MPRTVRLPKIIGLVAARSAVRDWLVYQLNASGAIGAADSVCRVRRRPRFCAAILMITNRNPVYSALWFALATLSVCGLFLLQSAPFLAAATVIVYAGAIVVTFVFVIMLAQQSGATVYDQRSRQPFLATVFGVSVARRAAGMLQVDERRGSCISRMRSRRSRRPTCSAIRRRTSSLDTMLRAGPVAVRRLSVRGRTGRHAALGGHDRRDCDCAATPRGDAMMGDVERYLAVGAVLFVLGAIGFFTRRNLIVMILSAELMLHGVSLTLVTFGRLHNSSKGRALRFSFSRWRPARRGWRCR